MTDPGFISEITNMAQFVKTIVIFAVIITIQVIYVQSAGPKCYECSRVAHTRDCRRIVQCGAHELCAVSGYVATDGINYFSSKCQSRTLCSSIIRKRADQEYCNECCTGDYCNTQLCDTKVNMRKRCFTCDDVVHPNDCNLVSSCDADQVCYTEKIFVNKEVRYRLGCTRNNTCSTQPSSVVSAIVGKRQAVKPTLPSITYCGECCNSEYCNRELCANGLPTGTISLVNPPPDVICQDYDSSACVALNHPGFCSDHNVRNFLCRRTCGFCGGGSYIPPGGATQTPASSTSLIVTPTQATTQTPTQTPTHGSCYDEAVNCKDPQILALVCNIDPKQCSLSCNQCSISSTTPVPSTTLAPTKQLLTVRPTQKYVCHDPIPECQCEYLDRELGLCNDNDQVDNGNTFCCYYCTRKYHSNSYTCPSTICDTKEKQEYERVKQENINVTCTHH